MIGEVSHIDLVIEGEPGDVDPAGGLEDAGRDLLALARVPHHDVRREGRVEVLVGGVVEQNVGLPHLDGRDADILGKGDIQYNHLVTAECSHRDAAVLGGVPLHAVVVPVEGQPDVARQDLVLLVQVHDLLQTARQSTENTAHCAVQPPT